MYEEKLGMTYIEENVYRVFRKPRIYMKRKEGMTYVEENVIGI